MELVIEDKKKNTEKQECQHEWKYEGSNVAGRYNLLYERNLYTCKKCVKQKYSKF